MSELSNIYDPNTFIKEVLDDRFIQIQDTYGEVDFTIDYLYFSSAIPDGRFLNITRSDNTAIRLQFSSNSKTITGANNLMTVIGQLKKGTYKAAPTTSTSDSVALDYSTMYHSSNFIKEVFQNKFIQIQDRLATKVFHSVDFNNITTTLTQGRFIIIYQTNTDPISLQFISNSESITAHTTLRETIDQLKDNTYNRESNVVGGVIYDPETFIFQIEFEDYSVQLVDTTGTITDSLVARQVTTVYAHENFVRVKFEASDELKSYEFASSSKAIEGAEELRRAIKTITDKLDVEDGSGVSSFSADFNSNVWKLDPPVQFSMSSFNLEYYEIVCPDGSDTCAEEDLVKQRCTGLVEIVGDEETNVLDYVNIYFNQTVRGRAILISK